MVVFLALLPAKTRAETCATLRPDWNGDPATQLSEAIGLFLSPAGLFLGAALAVAVLFRHPMGTCLVALLWSVFITFLVMPDASGQTAMARAEGCLASPTLFIGLSTAICALAVYYTFRRDPRL
jgi:hypothetical protein